MVKKKYFLQPQELICEYVQIKDSHCRDIPMLILPIGFIGCFAISLPKQSVIYGFETI